MGISLCHFVEHFETESCFRSQLLSNTSHTIVKHIFSKMNSISCEKFTHHWFILCSVTHPAAGSLKPYHHHITNTKRADRMTTWTIIHSLLFVVSMSTIMENYSFSNSTNKTISSNWKQLWFIQIQCWAQ